MKQCVTRYWDKSWRVVNNLLLFRFEKTQRQKNLCQQITAWLRYGLTFWTNDTIGNSGKTHSNLSKTIFYSLTRRMKHTCILSFILSTKEGFQYESKHLCSAWGSSCIQNPLLHDRPNSINMMLPSSSSSSQVVRGSRKLELMLSRQSCKKSVVFVEIGFCIVHVRRGARLFWHMHKVLLNASHNWCSTTTALL